MLNEKKIFQRAHGSINVKINNNEINRFYQSGSAKIFYPKSSQKFKELVLVNTAGGITSGDNFVYNFDIINNSKIFLTTQTAERAYKGFNDNAKINTDTTIRDFFSSKIKLKKARSGVTFEFNEKDIKPEYPIQKTIIKIIIDELIKLFFKIELFFAEKTLCQFP